MSTNDILKKEYKFTPKMFAKGVMWIIVTIFAIALWEISIPIIITWYLYKRNKTVSKRNKLIISIVSFILFFSLGSLLSAPKAVPVLTIVEPQNDTTVYSDKVSFKGSVSPENADININGISVEVDKAGNFIYEANVKSEKNSFNVEAVNGDKKSEIKTVKITRVFSEAELAERKRQEELAKNEVNNKAKQVLQKEIDSFKKPFDNSVFRETVLAMQMELALFSAYAVVIDTYKDNTDPEVKKLVKELENKVSSLQISEFPKLRKAYVDLMAKKMWEADMVVTAGGSGNKSVTFTAGIFASNKNIKDTHTSLSDMFELFRFNRVNYKWYKYDDEYTYFEIKSEPDGKIVKIK